MMQCRLCGSQFDTAGLACHTKCPMGSHCNLICCPNCGYQMVDESKSWLARLLRQWWPSAGQTHTAPPQPIKRDPAVVPLTHIPVGEKVTIQHLGHMSDSRLAQLSLFGLVPGSQVEIIQRRPAPVIRVGHTELALAEETIEQVWAQVADSS